MFLLLSTYILSMSSHHNYSHYFVKSNQYFHPFQWLQVKNQYLSNFIYTWSMYGKLVVVLKYSVCTCIISQGYLYVETCTHIVIDECSMIADKRKPLDSYWNELVQKATAIFNIELQVQLVYKCNLLNRYIPKPLELCQIQYHMVPLQKLLLQERKCFFHEWLFSVLDCVSSYVTYWQYWLWWCSLEESKTISIH